jgi:hypothetical protein
MVLPTINPNDKGQEIKIQICNSRMQTIGSVKEADNKSYDINTGKLNELSFTLPLYVDTLSNGLQKNKHAELLVNRCILKVKYGSMLEYFIINDHEDSDDNLYRNIHAYSLGYQMDDKIIKNYRSQSPSTPTDYAAPIDIETAITDALQLNRTWSVGYIDSAFSGMYRTFEFDSQTGLEYLYQIGTAFNAILVWDTVNRTVSAYHPDLYGTDKGFKITDDKYISNLVKKVSGDEFCTRLILEGKDGITINSISPLGVSYIEDFSYFMNNGMMSQELINALVDYNNYVESRKTEFPALLTQLNGYQSDMLTLTTDMATLVSNQTIIQDRLDTIKATNGQQAFSFDYSTSPSSYNNTFDDGSKRLLMFKLLNVDASDTPIILHNASSIDFIRDGWYTLKVDTSSNLTISNFYHFPIKLEGSFIKISDEDYALSIAELEDKYSLDKIAQSISSKQVEIDTKQGQIDSVLTQMTNLRNDLDIANHLTVADMDELDQFIIVKEYSDDNLVDAQSLLDAGKVQLAARNIPQVLFDVSLINFLNCLEEKRNWDKISIFDLVRIQSKKLDVDIKARIVNIKIDKDNIGLTIANSKNVKDEPDKFIQLLYGTASGTKSLQRKENTWDNASKVKTQFDDYLNSAIDATKQKIVAGLHENIQITERGIKVTSPDDINTCLIINHGCIAISRDGMNSWETAVTTDGVHAETIIGRLLIGSKLTIANENGTFVVDGGNVTINGGSAQSKIFINPTDGIKIQTSPDNGTTWQDTFFVDTNGILHARGLVITNEDGSASLIDAKNKTIDFSQFSSIFGSISADNIQGGTLTLGGTNETYGRLVVLDGYGEEIANLDASNGGFDKLWVGELSSPTIINYNNADLNYFVDPAGDDGNDGLSVDTPKQTIQACIDLIPKYNDGNITITCKAPPSSTRQDYIGNAILSSFTGKGSITIEGQNWYNYINGNVQVMGCTNSIFVKNFTINLTTPNAGVDVTNSTYVYCEKIWVYGQQGGSSYYAKYGSKLYLKNCEGYDSTYIIFCGYLSTIFAESCKGSGTQRGMVAQFAGTIHVTGTYPTGTTSATYADSAGIINLNGATVTGGTSGTTPTQQYTKQISTSTAASWNEYYSTYESDGVPRQGRYSTGVGNYRGLWLFGTSILDTIGTGKTIKSMRVWIQRATSSGQSGKVRHSIRAHGYAAKPAGAPSLSAEIGSASLGWGEGMWITLSSSAWASFASGSYKGLALYTSDGSNYSKCNASCTVEITYQ